MIFKPLMPAFSNGRKSGSILFPTVGNRGPNIHPLLEKKNKKRLTQGRILAPGPCLGTLGP